MAGEKPNCYKCKHRRDVPGDAHSRCAHPALGELANENNPFAALVTVLGAKRLRGGFSALEVARQLGVKGDAHGIQRGWFLWPANFDPVWLESCKGFESAKQDAPNESE